MNKFGAILHKKWIKSNVDNQIIGYWAEDYSTYTITVPYQLRDTIVDLQNWLSEKYQVLTTLTEKVDELKSWWEK